VIKPKGVPKALHTVSPLPAELVRMEPRALPPLILSRREGVKLRKRLIRPLGKTGIEFRRFNTLNAAKYLYEIWATFTCAQAHLVGAIRNSENDEFAKQIYYSLLSLFHPKGVDSSSSYFVRQSMRVLSINFRLYWSRKP